MGEILLPIAVFAAYIAIMRWVLPRFGVQT
jgi:hypothetical protein